MVHQASSSSPPDYDACPSRETLGDLALGRLPLDSIEAIGRHLEQCPACQGELSSFDETEDSVIRGLRGGARLPHGRLDAVWAEQLRRVEDISRVVWGAGGENPADDAPPRRLGQYELLEQVGRGGMGAVYKALHLRLKRHVALKLLPADRLRDPRAVARFQREMEAAGRLDHPNLVRALDAGEAEGRHFLVMEFLEGCDLARLIRRRGPLSVPDACEIVRQAGLGLAHAHEHGLIHRDVKPSNLMLTRSGQVKLLDLGLARLIEAPADAPDITATEQVVGTADFIAPEQARDTRAADARSDVYSLGATFYFLLAGHAPFADADHRTFLSKAVAHASEPAPSLTKMRSIPAAVDATMTRMLAKEPGRRFQAAADICSTLERFAIGNNLVRVSTADGGARSISAVPSPLKRAWFGAVVAVLAILAFASIYRILSREANGTNHQPAVVAATSMGVPAATEPSVQADATAAEAVGGRLERIDLPPALRTAMLTVVRQHPEERRWAGECGQIVFGVAAKRLGRTGEKDPATPGLMRLAAGQATNELITAKSLLDVYKLGQLTDATTLRAAVSESADKLVVQGRLRAITLDSSAEQGFAVSLAYGDRRQISAVLMRPPEMDVVREAYRDVMHAQARHLMAQGDWGDALLLWRHLHERRLVSRDLYLDAARCFAALNKPDDTVKVLDEAIDSFLKDAPSEFFERAGDVALGLKTPGGDILAERAYKLASQRLSQ